MTLETDIQAVLDELINDAEAELGHELDDDEIESLLDQALSGMEVPAGNAELATANTESQMTKPQLITWLTANCSAWKGKKDAEKTLGALDEGQLQALHANSQKAAKIQIVVNAVKAGTFKANADGGEVGGVSIPDVAELFGIATDPATDPVAFTTELKAAVEDFLKRLSGETPPAEPPPDEGVVMQEQKPAGNKDKPVPVAKPVLNRLTAEEQEDIAYARAAKNRQKQDLVQRLVGNIQDDARRQAKAVTLLKKPLAELEELVELIPAANESAQPPPPAPTFAYLPNYAGAAGGPAANYQDDSQNLLPMPSMDRSETASPKLRKKA